eukprot:71703-Chlamydomonas_euryale.AAC.3
MEDSSCGTHTTTRSATTSSGTTTNGSPEPSGASPPPAPLPLPALGSRAAGAEVARTDAADARAWAGAPAAAGGVATGADAPDAHASGTFAPPLWTSAGSSKRPRAAHRQSVRCAMVAAADALPPAVPACSMSRASSARRLPRLGSGSSSTGPSTGRGAPCRPPPPPPSGSPTLPASSEGCRVGCGPVPPPSPPPLPPPSPPPGSSHPGSVAAAPPAPTWRIDVAGVVAAAGTGVLAGSHGALLLPPAGPPPAASPLPTLQPSTSDKYLTPMISRPLQPKSSSSTTTSYSVRGSNVGVWTWVRNCRDPCRIAVVWMACSGEGKHTCGRGEVMFRGAWGRGKRGQCAPHAMCSTRNVFHTQCVPHAMCSTGQCVPHAMCSTGQCFPQGNVFRGIRG